MKKFLAVILSAAMVISITAVASVSAAENSNAVSNGSSISFETSKALYAHGVLNSEDTEAWLAWQGTHDANYPQWELEPSTKYFFLPTSADDSKVDIYNAFSSDVKVNGVTIASGETATVGYDTAKTYSVTAEGSTYKLIFMKSNAEAGIYINNSNADGNGTPLMDYLNEDKNRSAKATGAIVDANGNVDNTTIKKIKGRGNTTWWKSKKPYNITYDENVKIAGMDKSKKYSLLANYQDDSLTRNRFLYDLADAVELPYASDSRYVDFYVNGYYWGSYQMCEKVEVGKNNLIKDIDDKAYLNADGTINEDFPFLCEVDAGAKEGDDYFVECLGGNKITIKAPELEPGDSGYEEVKAYVKSKFDTLYNAARSKTRDLSDLVDLDSIAKLYLINELGKNWDSGVSSMFMVWKQDENGQYKFFGSPVWDYDNSLGNAAGIEWDLFSMGVNDYTEYTGWWCKYKGKRATSKSSSNIMTCFALNNSVMDTAAQVWFNDFVPALNDFYGVTNNGIMMSKDNYYSLLSNSANMNYMSGWSIMTGDWIADHTKLTQASFDNTTHKMVKGENKTYNQYSFTDMFNYASDWMQGRAAWLSEQFYPNWRQPVVKGDVNLDGEVTIDDVTAIQKHLADIEMLTAEQLKAAEVDGDGDVTIDDATKIQMVIAEIIEVL